jgi:hypothetical protein
LPAGADPHVGTMDLDLGLDLAILDDQSYEGIAERLREMLRKLGSVSLFSIFSDYEPLLAFVRS